MIKLETFGRADFDRFIGWIDSETSLKQFAGPVFTFPVTHQQLETYLQEENRYVYKVVYTPTGQVIGHAEISITNDGIAKLSRLIIGEAAFRGKGLGQQLVHALLALAFGKLGANTTELNVYDWNLPAIQCYRKEGFTMHPGKERTLEINGEVWTAVNMAVTKADWEKLNRGSNSL